MNITLKHLAALIDAPFEGDGQTEIRGVAGFFDAKPGDLTFATRAKHFLGISACRAAAVIVPERPAPPLPPETLNGLNLIRADNPTLAFARVLELFHPPIIDIEPGIDPGAQILPGARIGRQAAIGPFTFIGRDAVIGEGAIVGPHCTLGTGVLIGAWTRLHAGVHIYHDCVIGARCIVHSGTVIGSDGYGFTPDGDGHHHKIQQIGHVVIGEDVEIGANVTIDRGAIGPTVIGAGTKIDNLVHIAHNVRIGQHSLIVAQVGISGSVKTGHHVTLAGQVGIVGHVSIGSNVIVAARSVVTGDLPDGAFVMGFPAKPAKEEKKILVALRKLPELIRTINRWKRGAMTHENS